MGGQWQEGLNRGRWAQTPEVLRSRSDEEQPSSSHPEFWPPLSPSTSCTNRSQSRTRRDRSDGHPAAAPASTELLGDTNSISEAPPEFMLLPYSLHLSQGGPGTLPTRTVILGSLNNVIHPPSTEGSQQNKVMQKSCLRLFKTQPILNCLPSLIENSWTNSSTGECFSPLKDDIHLLIIQ